MNDRWQPIMRCILTQKDNMYLKKFGLKKVLLVRKSRIPELKEKYGDDLEVLF